MSTAIISSDLKHSHHETRKWGWLSDKRILSLMCISKWLAELSSSWIATSFPQCLSGVHCHLRLTPTALVLTPTTLTSILKRPLKFLLSSLLLVPFHPMSWSQIEANLRWYGIPSLNLHASLCTAQIARPTLNIPDDPNQLFQERCSLTVYIK